MKIPKTYEELENSNFFQEHGITDSYIRWEIRWAYKGGVPEAIPDMLKVRYDLGKMQEIRWAYENGVSEAVPDMMKVQDSLYKMRQIRLAYANGVPEAVPYMLKVKHDWRKMKQTLNTFIENK